MPFSLDMDLDVDMGEDAYEFGIFNLYSFMVSRKLSAVIEPCVTDREVVGSSPAIAIHFFEPNGNQQFHRKIPFLVMGQQRKTPVWGMVQHRKDAVSVLELSSVAGTL